jgi:hypothetical protein
MMAAMQGRQGRQGREGTRARALDAIPRYYVPWVHLGATTAVGAATLVVGVLSLHAVRASELLIVPLVFVLSNAFEWRVHKSVLHKRFWPLRLLYDRHTPLHHKIYQYDSMAIRSPREFRLVLIPAQGVAAVVVVTAPLAWGVARLLGANAGWLVLVTSALYVVSYELSHLSYHLPEDSFIGRLGIVRVLREHHRRHHHPALMQRWNFNVTVPLFDLLYRTIASKELVEATVRDPDAQRSGGTE